MSGKTRFSRWKSVRRSQKKNTTKKMGKEFQEFVAHKRARKRDVKINNKNRVEKHTQCER